MARTREPGLCHIRRPTYPCSYRQQHSNEHSYAGLRMTIQSGNGTNHAAAVCNPGIHIHGVGAARTGPMGYIVMKVQVEGVPSYGKDQVFLVIDDNSAYSRRVPVILGTPTINRVVMAMRESEMSTMPLLPMAILCHSYEFANGFYGYVGAESEEGTRRIRYQHSYKPYQSQRKDKLKDAFAVPAFGTLGTSNGRTEWTMMLDRTLRVITQAPYPEDQANLPNGLYVLSTYTQLNPGSCNIV